MPLNALMTEVARTRWVSSRVPMMVMAREMVLILGGQEYLPGAVTVLQIIAWSMPLSWFNGLTQYVLIALNKQRFLTSAYIIGFCFSFLANLVLMRRFGYTVSAVLHIVSEFILMIAFLFGIRKNLGKIGWWQIVGTPITAAVISALVCISFMMAGRGIAVAVFLLIYPILLWRLKVLTPEEQALLAPRFRREK